MLKNHKLFGGLYVEKINDFFNSSIALYVIFVKINFKEIKL